MSSRKAIPKKSLQQSNVLLRILFRILVKDYVVTAYLSDRLFLATGHILLKISSKISCVSNPKNIHGPHGEHGKEILVKDSSKDFDTQAKTGWKPNGFPSLGQHPEEERILVEIRFKDYSL